MIVELEKLSHSQAAITAAYRASLILQEAGLIRYPAAIWKGPALVIMEGDACVAGINYAVDDDDLTMSVDFAWALPSRPWALARLLMRLRTKFKGGKYTRLSFTAHHANDRMMKLVRVMGLTPHSSSYRIDL